MDIKNKFKQKSKLTNVMHERVPTRPQKPRDQAWRKERVQHNGKITRNQAAQRAPRTSQTTHQQTWKKKHFQENGKASKVQKKNNPAALRAIETQRRQTEKREKEVRIQEYKKKRMEKIKIISKKTRRGQPLMKDRMQWLLKEIQESKGY